MDIRARRHRVLTWLILLAAACLLRGGWLWVRFDDLQADVDGYRRLAVNLTETGIYGYRTTDAVDGASRVRPTAYRPPLYPLLLAGVGWCCRVPLAAIAGLHFVLGVATVAGVYVVARRWGLGNWAFVAALLTACDPILLSQSSRVMTETAATALAVLALLALTASDCRRTLLSGGLAAGTLALAVLCRPTFLVWFAAIGLVLLVDRSFEVRKRIRFLAVFALVGGVILSVWFARNLMVFGRPVIATTHGGYTLLLGNNEGFYHFLETADWGEVWDSAPLDARYNQIKASHAGDEVLADRWAYQEAQRCIRQQPSRFVRSCVVRAGRLWGVLPHRVNASESLGGKLQRYVVAIWYTLVFLLALLGVLRRGRRMCYRPYLWGLTLCLSFTVVHTFYWSNLRMRGPLMPVVCILAAIGLQSLIARIRGQALSHTDDENDRGECSRGAASG